MEKVKMGRLTDYNKVLPIVELYYCIQSEGSRATDSSDDLPL